MRNGLSFDVEEHFHALNLRPVAPEATWDAQERRVADSTRGLLELLADRDIRCTFFFLGWVARRDPDLVRAVKSAGHEVACHGMSHKMAQELGPDAFRVEARECKRLLEDLTGDRVDGFRASTFSITPSTRWALDVLIEEGYRFDSSVFPVRHDRYGDPSFPRWPVTVETKSGRIVELPMLTLRLFGANVPAAGGGYMRLLPPTLMRTAISRMNAAGKPGILYMHPWEFDPGQPRLLKRGLGAFRHYFGLARMRSRLVGLLDRYEFGTLGELTDAATDLVTY